MWHRSVLRHRDFRLLWLANSASAVGDGLVRVALALFVIGLTGSATDVGIVLAAYSVPLIVLVLVGGVLADRLPRHRVVVATDVVRGVLHALLAVLILAGGVRIWQLVVIGVLFATAEAFFRPAVNGLLPQTVPEDEIQEANALRLTAENVAEFAGPALATVLVLGVGAAAAFGLDALTFLYSAALLVRVRPRERGPVLATGATATVWADVRAGFAEVRSRAWVWATLASFCVAVFVLVAPLYVVGPDVARERYGDIAVYGYVLAAFGGGTVVGSLVALRWRPRYPMRQAMIVTLGLPGAVALFAAGAPIALTVAAMAIAGTGVALFDVWWLTALSEHIPPQLLSRVTSYDWACSFGLMPLGYLLAGPVADAVGTTDLLVVGAVVAFVALALGLAPRATRALERRSRARVARVVVADAASPAAGPL